MADNAGPVRTSTVVGAPAEPAMAAKAHPSGIVLKDDHVQVMWYYAVCGAVLIASGIAVAVTVPDGAWLVVMALLGSLIIIALLSAAAVPHLRQYRHSGRH